MSTYYKKAKSFNKKKLTRSLGVVIFLGGFITSLYIFFPFISWQLFFAPAFAQQNVANPIPKSLIVSSVSLTHLVSNNPLTGPDYNNAGNWFPGFAPQAMHTSIASYFMTIPKLNIKDAVVSTQDEDLGSHLVNFPGTAVPPNKGNAVVFGHSTLTWLFNAKNYHTIFANAYKLSAGDSVFVTVNGTMYEYKVYNVTVVEPTDVSVLSQQNDDSYLTIITCTPPGTTEFRLVIRTRLVTMH